MVSAWKSPRFCYLEKELSWSQTVLNMNLNFFRGTVLNNNNKGKWFKFNDTVVEEFEMTDSSVEAECFGGTYKAKVYEQCKLIDGFYDDKVNIT